MYLKYVKRTQKQEEAQKLKQTNKQTNKHTNKQTNTYTRTDIVAISIIERFDKEDMITDINQIRRVFPSRIQNNNNNNNKLVSERHVIKDRREKERWWSHFFFWQDKTSIAEGGQFDNESHKSNTVNA